MLSELKDLEVSFLMLFLAAAVFTLNIWTDRTEQTV